MGFGGLRGAVGIALAIHLDGHIHHNLFRTDPRRRYTTQLFGIVGGVAFLTLVVNGTLAGPLLKKLGLAKIGEARQEVAGQYKKEVKRKMFSHLLRLLGQKRFTKVDFAAVKKHISWFDDLTSSEIRFLVKRNKETTPVLTYNEPSLSSFKPFVDPDVYSDILHIAKADPYQKLKSVVLMASAVAVDKDQRQELIDYAKRSLKEDEDATEQDTPEHLIELRKVFVDLLDKAYDQLFDTGEVEVRNVNMVVSYKTSVEVSRDSIAKGHPINDWKVVVNAMVNKEKFAQKFSCGFNSTNKALGKSVLVKLDKDTTTNAKDLIYYGTGFIEAHTRAQAAFKSSSSGQMLSDEKMQVLEESQVRSAFEGLFTSINASTTH